MEKKETVSINGYTAKVLDEQRFLVFERAGRYEVVAEHNTPKRVTPKFLASLPDDVTRVEYIINRYCVYDLRHVMKQVRGRYERQTIWTKSSNRWVRSTKIVNDMY